MSLRDVSQFLDELGIDRSHIAINEWVHKVDLQPISTVTADQLGVDENAIHARPQNAKRSGVRTRAKLSLTP